MKLDLNPKKTIHQTVLQALEDSQGVSYGSNRLGASGAGNECARQEWYKLRWSEYDQVSGRMARLFETGHQHENKIIEDLQKAGYRVVPLDPKTGRQFEFSAHDGQVVCKIDGIIRGNGLDEWHILEVKTANRSSFNAVVKHGMRKKKVAHYAQGQIAMLYSGLRSAVYIMENKDTSDLHSEIVAFDEREAKFLDEFVVPSILNDSAPPARLHDSMDKYPCSFCKFRFICHEEEQPRVNCRSCEHGSAMYERADGDYKDSRVVFCNKRLAPRSIYETLKACGDYETKEAYNID